MKEKRIVVISADAMVYEDLEYLKTKPNFSLLCERGSIIKTMKTCYPSVTYPAHVTMSTGCYPNKHGVVNNNEFCPGLAKDVPWNWFADVIKTPDIFKAAKDAGLTTAAIFWPVTGNHKYIDYLVDEYWPQYDGDKKKNVFLRSGTTEQVYNDTVAPFIDEIKIRKHPETDEFIIKCACEMIKKYKPNLLMIHPANLDSYRHGSGLFNEKITKGLDETDEWLGMLFDAAREAEVFEETDFFLVSDHGQRNINRSIKLNVFFADAGLITTDINGKLTDWQAYSHSTGMSSQIRLKDPDDKELYNKVYELLLHMKEEGIYGIGEVFTAEEIDEKEHLNGEFSFVVETDGYTSFSDDWRRPVVKVLDNSDYRFGKATHGYLPDLGPQPVFTAFGPHIKKGVVLERKNTVDEAPTYARILGVEMPWADGSAIDEILELDLAEKAL